jgi:hypothetical protein
MIKFLKQPDGVERARIRVTVLLSREEIRGIRHQLHSKGLRSCDREVRAFVGINSVVGAAKQDYGKHQASNT